MGFVMRKACATDVDGLDLVMQVISDGPGDQEKMVPLIEKMAEDPQKYLLVAVEEESGRIVGSLLGVVFEDICGDCSPILLVENVAALEEFQGRGVGRGMFEEIERWGKEMGCHYEILVSGNGRVGAHKFYRKLQFEEVKGFKKHF